MSNVIKTKKKRASTLSLIKNMKTIMTLSDRLKLAGIREFKPQSDVKAGSNLKKNSKKRKKTFKTTKEKLRNLPEDFFTKDSDKNQTLKTKKDALERSLRFPRDSNSSIKKNAEETLSVSLDFIKDCQMYRKKVIKPKEDNQLSNPKRKNSASSFDCKQYHFEGEKSDNSLKEKAPNENKTEDSSSTKKILFFHENNKGKLDLKEIIGDGLKDSIQEIVKTFQKIEPFINKLPISDIAKIDKKYLESVISLANNPEPSAQKNSEKGEVEKENTKPLTGKTFCHGESKNKELGMGVSKTDDKTDKSKKLQKTSRYSLQQPQKDQISSRVVRDSTKSEVQLQVRKNIGGQRNSEEIKIEKEAPHSKSELSDGRKKRKHRNIILKNNKTDLIEIPFSSEVSKAKDVKELWRRETKKKSDNSLTSHSSCTIPESDENPKWKNLGLQSYRILHKLVEEEINKISKKSENKKNIKEVKNQENYAQKVQEIKTGNIRERIKSKNILNKMKFPAGESPVEEKEALLAKKKLILAENLNNYSTYEGEKNKAELLSLLDDNLVKTAKKLPENLEKGCIKISDQTLQNWTIINRLEQAFLALGSSNFQSEKKLTKQAIKNNPPQNCELSKEASKESEKQNPKPQTQTTHGTLSSRKTLRPKPKARLNINESTPTKKKREDVKSPSPESKEKKQNEQNNTEPSNVSNQSKNGENSLSRRKTYIITLKEPPTSQIPKFNCLNKTLNFKHDKIKKNITEAKKKEPKNQEKNITKDKPSTPNSSIQSTEEKTKLTSQKNQAKPATYEITPLYHKNFKFKSGIPKPKIRLKQRREKAKVLEELLQHQMNEKKEVSQRTPNERPVKERSILSMHGSQKGSQQSMEKFQTIQEKTSIDFAPILKSSIGDLLIRNAQKNFEDLCQNSIAEEENINFDIPSTDKSETADRDSLPNPDQINFTEKIPQTIIINTPKPNLYDSKAEFDSAGSLGQQQLCITNPMVSKNSQELESSKNLFLWEKDIRRYREIVKDIMSQYKRIDGFLKQSERLGLSSKKSVRNVSSKKSLSDEQPSKLITEPHALSLQEYRKKIINEYQTLPFFEYKQFKKDENTQLEEAKKRHLSVASDINKEMDFDVKDYQPNIKKVLDSQLYVDKEIVFKQTTPDDKVKNKKLSLQEMVLTHDRDALKENCLKCYSMPKTFLLYGGEFRTVQPNNQRQRC